MNKLTPEEAAALAKFKLDDEDRNAIPVGTDLNIDVVCRIKGMIHRHADGAATPKVWTPSLEALVAAACDGKVNQTKIKALLRKAREVEQQESFDPKPLKTQVDKASQTLYGTFLGKPSTGRITGSVIYDRLGNVEQVNLESLMVK